MIATDPKVVKKPAPLPGYGMFLAVLVILVLAIVVEYLLHVSVVIFDITIGMVSLMTIILLIRTLFPGFVRRIALDERLQKARAQAIAYSWYLTIAFMIALQLADSLRVFSLTMNEALMYTLLVALYSFLVLSWYYGRMADVELSL